jgi:hypothetical protein
MLSPDNRMPAPSFVTSRTQQEWTSAWPAKNMSAPRLMMVRPLERRSNRSSSCEMVGSGVDTMSRFKRVEQSRQAEYDTWRLCHAGSGRGEIVRLTRAYAFCATPQRNSLVKLNAGAAG